MDCACHVPIAEYLTRSDIARILQVSPKQAGRLMAQMPTILIGRKHRRVARADFDSWAERQRSALISSAHGAMRRRSRTNRTLKSEDKHPVTRAVQELVERRRREAEARHR